MMNYRMRSRDLEGNNEETNNNSNRYSINLRYGEKGGSEESIFKQTIFFHFSPRTSVNKRFCQLISLSTVTVILLCGSMVAPFFVLKNAKNTIGESDVDDESYSG